MKIMKRIASIILTATFITGTMMAISAPANAKCHMVGKKLSCI